MLKIEFGCNVHNCQLELITPLRELWIPSEDGSVVMNESWRYLFVCPSDDGSFTNRCVPKISWTFEVTNG
jgi:hypothetical protein